MNTGRFSFLWFNTIVLAAAVFTAQAQTIDFNNNRPFRTPADRRVLDVNCEPLVGTNYAAQLYYGPNADNLLAVTTAPARFRPEGTALPGTWTGGTRTLTGFAPGQTVYLQVRVWDIDLYPTFDQATDDMTGAQYGKSAVFTYVVPAMGSDITAYYMEGFRGFKLVTNPPPNVLAIQENGERVDIIYKGTHTIQGAENLTGPWVNVASGSGPFTDSNSGTLPRRFYRINDGGMFSDNAVGYYRLGLCSSFSMIANQLNAPGGNTITNVFKSAPNGSQVYKFNRLTGGYTFLQFIDNAWEGNHLDLQLNPGEGTFFYSPAAFTQRFLGEVQLSSSVPIPSGFSMISSPLPIAGSLTLLPPTGPGFPAQQGDQVYQWVCGGNAYIFNQFIDGTWEGDDGGGAPSISVGEAFFIYRSGSSGTWNRSFSVGP